MFSALWDFAARQWLTHRLRVALTAVSIALGVGVYFAVATANAALLESLSLTVERLAGKAALEVVAGESGFPEGVLDQVRAIPGVQLAEPVIEVIAHTALQDEGNLLILGVDTTAEQRLHQFEFDLAQSQLADPLTYLTQPNSILLSGSFAARHRLKLGDQLTLYTPRGRQAFTVQGLFKPTGVGAVFGGNIAVMDVYSMQLTFDRGHNLDRIDLLNSADLSIADLRSRLRAQLPRGLQIVSPRTRGEALQNAVTAMRLGMSITSFIALLVGVYIIINSFSIAVNQRWKDLGVLRAVGVPASALTAMFLVEALLLGVLGSLAGVVGGYGAAALTGKIMGSIAASVYGVVATEVAPTLHPGLACGAFALGIGAALFGAWLPARTAAKIDPILALHHIELRQPEKLVGWLRISAAVLLLCLSTLLIVSVPAAVGTTLPLGVAVIMFVGLILLMPALVHWTARLLRPALDWLGGSEGALAMDAMIQSPRRSAGTVGALMIGLMFVYSTAAYIQSYRHMIDRWSDQLLNADLFVAATTLLRSTSYHFSEALGRRIAALPEVQRVENVRFLSVPFRDDTAALIAIEMDGFLARASNSVTGGNAKTLRELLPTGRGALVSRNFASRWGIRVGERVSLDTPTGQLVLPVAGMVDDYRSDKGSIFLDRALYKMVWKDDAVDFVDVSLRAGASIARAKRDITRLTADSEHALVYTNAEFRGWIAGLVDQFFLLNYMQLVIAVLVAVLGISNTLFMSVAERRREFGILRSIGALKSQLRKLVLLEAVAVSFVGVIVGTFCALFNIQFMSHTVSTALAGYDVPFVFPWQVILVSLPVVVAVSLLAAWAPARRAMQTPVLEAIGHE